MKDQTNQPTRPRHGAPDLTLPPNIRRRVLKLCARYNINPKRMIADAVKAAVYSCETDDDFLLGTIKSSPGL